MPCCVPGRDPGRGEIADVDADEARREICPQDPRTERNQHDGKHERMLNGTPCARLGGVANCGDSGLFHQGAALLGVGAAPPRPPVNRVKQE